ncbi:sel1 repeat family protein [Vibrio sp. ZSDZ34]|uniref:Sel1 repeat family protein n=1 Tax=Vibrio gelatinilyticus TaxID=2893468 RepID=A0A9X2AYN7_9VIBR|nr:tetratricopeptide repeat protein [Vibrio gelatinilyticus]MCJ2376902.1 sel1 repeat family protein [Vibrio gelatinilyticus]
MKIKLLIVLLTTLLISCTSANKHGEKGDKSIAFTKSMNDKLIVPMVITANVRIFGFRHYDYCGIGDPIGFKEIQKFTLKELLDKAKDNDGAAQYRLGVMYDIGYQVAESDHDALYWYWRAAENGDSRAQFLFGMRAMQGTHVKKNLVISASWLEAAHLQGHPCATTQLARLYLTGSGVASDPEYALTLLKQSEKYDHNSIFHQAKIHQNGLGVEKNTAKADELFIKAGRSGHITAQFLNGHRYQLENDLESAKYWYELGSAGHATAQYQLALILIKERVSEEDYLKGISLLEESSELGFAPASYYLGTMIVKKENKTEKDIADSLKWFRLAANQGHFRGMNFIGHYYAEGKGVEQSYSTALEWYLKSLQVENSDSNQYALNQLPNTLRKLPTGVIDNETQSYKNSSLTTPVKKLKHEVVYILERGDSWEKIYSENEDSIVFIKQGIAY